MTGKLTPSKNHKLFLMASQCHKAYLASGKPSALRARLARHIHEYETLVLKVDLECAMGQDHWFHELENWGKVASFQAGA